MVFERTIAEGLDTNRTTSTDLEALKSPSTTAPKGLGQSAADAFLLFQVSGKHEKHNQTREYSKPQFCDK